MTEFDLRFAVKEIRAWGRIGIMKRMLDQLGFEEALTKAGLPQPGRNRTQFMPAVWCGANRFERGEVTRYAPACA